MLPDESVHDPSDEERLAEIIEVVIAIANNDFDRRASVRDGRHLLDGLATGLNMLSEEVQRRYERDRQLQQLWLQNERLIAVGQLAAGVAHELNNPAAFVLTNLTVLQRTLTELESALADRSSARITVGEALDLTRINISGIQRIVAILRELRAFSRFDAREPVPLVVQEVIDDACQLVRAELAYRATLEVRVDPALRVCGDRTKLAQVLTNLLLNAAQAMVDDTPGQNRVSVSAAAAGEWAIITVADTGGGMSDEARAHLFEPFFTTKPREQGTGLGLAISADIVRQHEGQLRLVQTSPAGTTFEVRLPLTQGDPASAEPPAPSVEVPTAARARVLIIDDERYLLDSYARFFADCYDVELAPGGRQALARLQDRTSTWDAILCDMMMPEVDGIALFEWVTANRPALADRMLFCTGGAFTPRGIAFVQRMQHRVLDKPVPLNDLREAIDAIASRGGS